MLLGLGFLVAFIVGGLCMFAVSEHYYHRIESILRVRRDDPRDRRR